ATEGIDALSPQRSRQLADGGVVAAVPGDKRRLSSAVLDELQGEEGADTPHVTDHLVVSLQGLKSLTECRFQLSCAFEKSFFAHGCHGRQASGHRNGMARVGMPAHQRRLVEVAGEAFTYQYSS